MNRVRTQLWLSATLVAAIVLSGLADGVEAKATEGGGYEFPNSGIASVLSPSAFDIEPNQEPEEKQLNIHEKFEQEDQRMLAQLTMANVGNTLNVRAEASEDSELVGKLYRDCGGTILEQKDGWTKIQSGALTGWCSDEYLIFSDEAIDMAHDVGQWLVTSNKDALRVRKEPSENSEVLTIMSKSDIADFMEIVDDNWICVDFEGNLGYVNTEYINIIFHIDSGETKEQIATREIIEARIREQLRIEAEEKAKKEKAEKIKKEIEEHRTENRGAYAASAEEIRLLAALIWCEAGNQSYEGMVAVGAVVMNRVKSPAYPNTIYSVIYASGQFTPAMSGKVARIYESGPKDICYQAAAAALNGETTVGGATHFRRNNGRPGYVLGDHVFW